MILDIGFATSPGDRSEHNTDVHGAVQHWVTDTQLAQKGRLYLLADNIGDPTLERVARHAVNRLYQLYYTHPANSIPEALEKALMRVNTEVYEEGRRNQEIHQVTLLAAVVQGNHLYLANVGYNRAYLLRKDKLQQLTIDREPDMVLPPPQDDGLLPAAFCVGYAPDIRIDAATYRFALGDKLLLCSDGLYRNLTEEQIQPLLTAPAAEDAAVEAQATEIADRLVLAADQHPHKDSVSALVLAAAAKGNERGALPQLASWVSWALAGSVIVIILISVFTWARSCSTPPTAPTVTPTPTLTRLAQPTGSLPAILRPTNTLAPTTVSPTDTARPPTARPAQPTATAEPVPATSTPTSQVPLEQAPRPIAPYEEEAIYELDNNVLIWQWYRQLGPNEYYAIRIWPEGAGRPSHTTIRTGSREYRFGLPIDQAGKHLWDVVVVRDQDGEMLTISEPSAPRTFWWMGPRPASAASPTTPPTATPVPPTATPIPPTSTPVPPTDTPVPPTNTPVPPTNTPIPTPTPLP